MDELIKSFDEKGKFATQLVQLGIRSEADLIKALNLNEKQQFLFRTWVKYKIAITHDVATNLGKELMQIEFRKLLNIKE